MAEHPEPPPTRPAEPASPAVKLVVDPASPVDESEETAMPNLGANTGATASKSSLSPPTSPPTSPPAINPGFRRQSGNSVDSASSYDFPPRAPGQRRSVQLPGDLGARDPRRPKSPDPASSLPGDLGAKDPRKPRSGTSSPVPSRHARNVSVDVITRIHEDPPRENEDDADADNDNDSERDDHWRGRGRIRPEPGATTSGKSINVDEDSEDSERDAPSVVESSKPDPTKGQSKLSFQRENRQKAAAAHAARKRLVHPSTAFDSAPSGMSTPHHSDDETRSEMLAAQKLSLTMSAIHSTPSAHRVIRQIIRGDFEHFQHEAEAGRKRQRMYLVATDLSPEAEYALEWTIGTVLRDGDTLFAVYAADEESVGMAEEGGGVEIGHGAESVRDTAAIVKSLATTFQPPQSPGPSPLSRAAVLNEHNRSSSRGGSGNHHSPAETERRRALEDITQRCVRLLRKTRLQVRVVVEVFHCKSPRHMITEVIDFLSPTLVIIGSRGRSAVKGVLLGSFSNYLVTKSSVPVMVARKKLRKHSKTNARHKDGLAVPYTGSGRTGRFSNVIEAPRTTGLRVKGWDEVGID